MDRNDQGTPRKLRIDADELKVDSFEAMPGIHRPDGTVEGFDASPYCKSVFLPLCLASYDETECRCPSIDVTFCPECDTEQDTCA